MVDQMDDRSPVRPVSMADRSLAIVKARQATVAAGAALEELVQPLAQVLSVAVERSEKAIDEAGRGTVLARMTGVARRRRRSVARVTPMVRGLSIADERVQSDLAGYRPAEILHMATLLRQAGAAFHAVPIDEATRGERIERADACAAALKASGDEEGLERARRAGVEARFATHERIPYEEIRAVVTPFDDGVLDLVRSGDPWLNMGTLAALCTSMQQTYGMFLDKLQSFDDEGSHVLGPGTLSRASVEGAAELLRREGGLIVQPSTEVKPRPRPREHGDSLHL
jgi:hypothetical protein